MPNRKIICPKCGAEMNHHADKLIYLAELKSETTDPALGGLIEENHCCPGCGAMATRIAD